MMNFGFFFGSCHFYDVPEAFGFPASFLSCSELRPDACHGPWKSQNPEDATAGWGGGVCIIQVP